MLDARVVLSVRVRHAGTPEIPFVPRAALGVIALATFRSCIARSGWNGLLAHAIRPDPDLCDHSYRCSDEYPAAISGGSPGDSSCSGSGANRYTAPRGRNRTDVSQQHHQEAVRYHVGLSVTHAKGAGTVELTHDFVHVQRDESERHADQAADHEKGEPATRPSPRSGSSSAPVSPIQPRTPQQI